MFAADNRVDAYLGRVLDRDGQACGTCFHLGSGVFATAWHVLDDLGEAGQGGQVQIDPLQGGPAQIATVVALDQDHDLAILRAADPLPARIARLQRTDKVTIDTRVRVLGAPKVHDDYDYHFLEASGSWAGGTTRDHAIHLARFRSPDILPGMSGAPVTLLETRQSSDHSAVLVGVVSGRYNSVDGWMRDTVWVARAEDLDAMLSGFDGVARLNYSANFWADAGVASGSPPISSEHESVRWPVTVGRSPREVAGSVDRRPRLTQVRQDELPIVLVGDGGVGKSEMAAQEFRSWKARISLWITATSRGDVLTAYRSAAAQLRLDLGESDEATADRLLGWLGRCEEPWVVVLDDIGNIEEVHDLLPSGPAGLAIGTTRWATSAVDSSAVRIDVGVFSTEESKVFLEKRLSHHVDPNALDSAQALAEELGHLPLALAYAAAVIQDDQLTCAEYLDLLRAREASLAELMPQEPRQIGSSYGRKIASTWQIALERANERTPVGLARPLWRILSCLDPNGAPKAALTSETIRQFLAGSGSRSISVNQVKKALTNLSALSLSQSLGTDLIRTHVLAQRVTREGLEHTLLREFASVAADALLERWPTDAEQYSAARTFAGNADVLEAVCEEALWQADGVHEILYVRGRRTGEMGRVISAARYFGQLVEKSSLRVGVDHKDTLRAQQEHAHWLSAAGEDAEAAALAELLLKRIQDPIEALSLRHLRASCLGKSGHARAAVDELTLVLAELSKLPSRNEIILWQVRAQSARWLSDLDLVRGLRELRQILREVHNSPHATSTHCKRLVIFIRGLLLECEDIAGESRSSLQARRSLAEDAERVLGRIDPETLALRNRLALAESTVGTVDAAAAVQRRLYDDIVAVFDPEDPRLSAARLELARLEGLSVGPRQAIAQLEAALAEERSRGVPETELYYLREGLAKWRGRGGRPDLAHLEYQGLLDEQRTTLGDKHPQTMLTRYQLIHWSGVIEDDPQSQRESLENYVVDARAIWGDDGQLVTASKVQLLSIRFRSGEHVGPEVSALHDELVRRGDGESTQALTLRCILLNARILTGDRAAFREVRHLLRLTVDRHGSGHPIAQVLRGFLKDFRP